MYALIWLHTHLYTARAMHSNGIAFKCVDLNAMHLWSTAKRAETYFLPLLLVPVRASCPAQAKLGLARQAVEPLSVTPHQHPPRNEGRFKTAAQWNRPIADKSKNLAARQCVTGHMMQQPNTGATKTSRARVKMLLPIHRSTNTTQIACLGTLSHCQNAWQFANIFSVDSLPYNPRDTEAVACP